MKTITVSLIAVLALASVSGCASSRKSSRPKDIPQVIIPAITNRPIAETSGTTVGKTYVGEPSPVAVTPATRAIPVYTGPKIVQTVLAPYEDEKGRLFGPQVMYEKVTEGRMNPEALENPELAYIPPENLVVPPGMGNPVSSVAMQRQAEEAPRLPTDIIDPRDILVTGLISNEANRAEAERMAKNAGRRARFDPDIGWILIPESTVK